MATEPDMLKALDRYYAAGGESVETLIADMEQDADLAAAVAGRGEERHDRPDRASRPWPTAPRSASC